MKEKWSETEKMMRSKTNCNIHPNKCTPWFHIRKAFQMCILQQSPGRCTLCTFQVRCWSRCSKQKCMHKRKTGKALSLTFWYLKASRSKQVTPKRGRSHSAFVNICLKFSNGRNPGVHDEPVDHVLSIDAQHFANIGSMNNCNIRPNKCTSWFHVRKPFQMCITYAAKVTVPNQNVCMKNEPGETLSLTFWYLRAWPIKQQRFDLRYVHMWRKYFCVMLVLVEFWNVSLDVHRMHM